jgi:hypothetical protein
MVRENKFYGMFIIEMSNGIRTRVMCFLITLLFFNCPTPAFTQNIEEVLFDARWLVFSNPAYFANTQAMMVFEGESVINLSFNKSDSTKHHMGERWHFRLNSQMQVLDSFQVWNRSTTFRPSVTFDELAQSVTLIQDGLSGVYYHFETLIMDDTTMEINLYSSTNDLRRDSLIFSKQKADITEVVPYLYDTTLNLIFSARNGIPPLIKKYSLIDGRLIMEDSSFTTGISLGNFSFGDVRKVIPSPQEQEDVFLFKNGPSGCLIRINWRHQKFEKLYDSANNKIDDSLLIRFQVTNETYFDVFFEDTNRFIFIGSHKSFDLPTTQNYSYQLAIHEINNQDSLLSVREYGNPSSPDSNDVIGLIYRKYGSTEYILGREGSDRWGFYIPNDTMELVLYTIDSTGVDSLYIHGYGNHMPLDMQRMSNGDIYISSVLSTNQSNHQVYASLTKIPASLLISVKEQMISRKLYLYPNPTQGILRSDEFLSADMIRVFSISGKLEESFKGYRESVPLHDLNAGTYIIQVQSENKISSGIIVKQ